VTSARRLLIRGGRLVTLDDALGDLERGDVLIEGGRIAAVAPAIEAGDCAVLEAAGMIVSPGFVDTHRHVWQTQLRTVATDWSLFDYFARMRCIYSALYGPEDVYLGNHVGALEALNAGITTLVDHCHIVNSPEHGDEAVRGLRDAGIRGIFCYGLFSNPTPPDLMPERDASWRSDDLRRMRRRHFASDDALLTLGLAPNEAEGSSLQLICDEIALGREVGARRISLHVAMGAYDRGRRVVGALAEAGVLGEDLLFVHGSALADDELDRIADAGAGIAATPETELQMGMGHPVTARALARSVRTSLGVDIVSNYAGDMFAPMRLQLQAQRGLENARLTAPPRAIRLQARDVLRLATLGGAAVAGLDGEVGSLTPGKQADLILTRTDAINMTPATDPVGALVLNANVHDVDTVLVAGRVVKSQGRLVGVDWRALADRLVASAARIHAGFAAAPVARVEALAAQLML
jgi:cytosine/adenosine deaminase-related metal-dependent hydrolase